MAKYLAGVPRGTGNMRWRRLDTEEGDQDKVLILGVSRENLSAIKGLRQSPTGWTLDMGEFLSDGNVIGNDAWITRTGVIPVTYEQLPRGNMGLILRF